MLRMKKLSHHKHTGRLIKHTNTSYLPLFIIIAVAAFPLTAATLQAQSPPPQSESMSLTGIMPGEPPTQAAVIQRPTDSSRFSTSPVEVSGTCPKNVIVQVYKNDIFAGSVVCSTNGTFRVEVDLLIGENILTAKVFDSLSQEGPVSQPVKVFYDALPPQSTALGPLNFGGSQMLLNTETVFRGIFPNKVLTVPVSIIGGRAPYAINVFWGDTSNDVLVRNDSSVFNLEHTYKRPGTYQMNIQATDADGRVAFLSVAVIVNGVPGTGIASGSTGSGFTSSLIFTLWPAYLAIVAIAGGFLLGEIREKRVLKKRGLLLNPPTPRRS